MLAAPDGDHEVIAEEDHHLTGRHDLRGLGQLLVLDVGDGRDDHEQVVAEHLQLGAGVPVHGVLDRQRVQVELGRQRHQVLVLGVFEAEPDEAFAGAGQPGRDAEVLGRLADAVDVPGPGDDRARAAVTARLGRRQFAAGRLFSDSMDGR